MRISGDPGALAALQERKGVSTDELAVLAHVGRSTVYRALRGHTVYPHTLAAIVSVLERLPDHPGARFLRTQVPTCDPAA